MIDQPDWLHKAARRALLDALEAVLPFRDSLVVVGAQALYMRTAESPLALAPFTTDGDLMIDPRKLAREPALQAVLTNAKFKAGEQPGCWRKSITIEGRDIEVDVDFLVPESVAPGSGSRSVRLDGHDRRATRRVFGLEAALVDHSPMAIAALEHLDSRSVTIEVAGVGALLIAKVHKIFERVATGRSQRTPVDKDAADVYRLIQATALGEMTSALRLTLATEVSAVAAESAIARMSQLFGRRGSPGIAMATRAIGVAGESQETIEAVLINYSSALAESLKRGT